MTILRELSLNAIAPKITERDNANIMTEAYAFNWAIYASSSKYHMYNGRFCTTG